MGGAVVTRLDAFAVALLIIALGTLFYIIGHRRGYTEGWCNAIETMGGECAHRRPQ